MNFKFKVLTRSQQRFINGGTGPAGGDSSTPGPTGCTGDVDGNPDTTWDRYCKDGEDQQ